MDNLLDRIANFFSTVRPMISDNIRPAFEDPDHKDLIFNKILELRSSNYKERTIQYEYKGKIYGIRPVVL